MSIGALFWFWLATTLLIPLFREGDAPRQLNAVGQALTLLQNPEAFADYLLRWGPVAFDYLVFYLWPFGWLPLAGPASLLAALPAFLLNFLAPLTLYEIPIRPQSWHGLSMLPLLALATVDGLHYLLKMARRAGWQHVAQRVLPLALLISSLVASLIVSPLPFSRSTYVDLNSLYRLDARTQSVATIAGLIPESASVSAEFFLGSHLLNRQHLFWFPRGWERVDYIALGLQSRFQLSPEDLVVVGKLRASAEHEVVYEHDAFVVFRHR